MAVSEQKERSQTKYNIQGYIPSYYFLYHFLILKSTYDIIREFIHLLDQTLNVLLSYNWLSRLCLNFFCSIHIIYNFCVIMYTNYDRKSSISPEFNFHNLNVENPYQLVCVSLVKLTQSEVLWEFSIEELPRLDYFIDISVRDCHDY